MAKQNEWMHNALVSAGRVKRGSADDFGGLAAFMKKQMNKALAKPVAVNAEKRFGITLGDQRNHALKVSRLQLEKSVPAVYPDGRVVFLTKPELERLARQAIFYDAPSHQWYQYGVLMPNNAVVPKLQSLIAEERASNARAAQRAKKRGGFNPFKIVGNAVKSTTGFVSKTLTSIPVVGPGVNAAFNISTAMVTTPLNFAANVATGQRIDKAAYNTFKAKVKDYQDIAPYAQTVVSLVPGIGQGISGAIGAANALSKGRPITEAIIEGARGALPGGPVAGAAFDVAVAAVQGKPVTEVALSAIPLPPDQKKMVAAAIMAAKDLADGKRVDETIYNRGIALLPPDAQKAVTVGVAIAQGQKLQKIVERELPGAVGNLVKVGNTRIANNPVFKAGTSILKSADEKKGFSVGLGLMAHKLTPTALLTARKTMNAVQKKGFDIAVSAHVGALKAPVKGTVPPKKRFGYYVTQGMQGNPKAGRKTEMMKTIVKDPDARVGAGKAVKEIKAKKPTQTSGFWAFWNRMLNTITAKIA